ncbi:MAG: CpXC domain-containing protein [candidate division WOR-3 bacterium]
MSRTETIEFACPKCQHQSQVTIYRSIKATADPCSIQQLLQGRINRFCCSKCNHAGYILVSLLYHDMARRFIVHYHPFPAVQNDQFLGQFDARGHPRLDRSQLPMSPKQRLSYFSEIHVVFDLAELVRYIIFRERLFDQRVAEGVTTNQ